MSVAILRADADGGVATLPVDTTRPPAASLCRVCEPSQDPDAAYDAYVGNHSDATLFHTRGWLRSVQTAFPHRPFHLVAVRHSDGRRSESRGEEPVGVLPMFLIRSRLGGRMLVSVPYGVGGGVLADDETVARRLLEAAIGIANRERAGSIEFRSREAGFAELPTSNEHVTFERELPPRADEVLEWLPRKARAAARNGRDKFRLTLEYGTELLPEVWRLYSANMRRLASIAYPYRFLKALTDAFADRIWISLVRREGRPVAGLVTFLFGDRVHPYFFGCSADARRCSAANFLYFKIMERGVAAGYRVFDFGRSRRDNAGSYDFKRFHGFEPMPLAYQRWLADGAVAPRLSPGGTRFRFARRIWPLLPLRFTQFAGGYLARHIPG